MAQLFSLGIMDTTTQEREPLTKTLKPIYAYFVFKQHQKALAFVEKIDELDWTVSVIHMPDFAHWQATVRRQIHPVFEEITVWLATLTARAADGGDLDGWGHD